MERDDYQQARAIFHAVMELSPDERDAFLNERCSGTRIRHVVEQLLNSYDSEFMERPAIAEVVLRSGEDNDLLPGRLLGHYRIRKRIGTGGTGEIYLADDIILERPVALKFLPTTFIDDNEGLMRFRREVRAVSALNHPNVVTIHEIGSVDDTHFIATEYIAGMTLRGKLAKGPIARREALEIAMQIASALDVVHCAGIIHRDIKPENVMVREDGLVKVLDFGLAKLAPEPTINRIGGSCSITTPGIVIGTVTYMSPEQARGMRVDERTDIWSLGVVIYEMLSGRPPFQGETKTDSIAAILASEPAMPVSDRSELDRLVRRCLEKDRNERFRTVKDLLRELRPLVRAAEASSEMKRAQAT